VPTPLMNAHIVGDCFVLNCVPRPCEDQFGSGCVYLKGPEAVKARPRKRDGKIFSSLSPRLFFQFSFKYLLHSVVPNCYAFKFYPSTSP